MGLLIKRCKGEKNLLKVISFINKIGIIFYIATIILAIMFNMLGFEIINPIVSNIFKVVYLIILICAILSFYNSKKKNTTSIIFIFLPILLLFTSIPLKVVTMIIVFPAFLFKGIKLAIRTIGIYIYLVFIAFGILGLCIGDFGANTIINEQYSPDNMYRVVTIDSDQGALGGDTIVNLEGIYFGIIKKDIKTLYHGQWGEKPNVIWVNNNIVNIDGRNMNIHVCRTWENKD